MKSKLLEEIQQVLERKELMNVTLPMPNYLFIEKYGRSIKKEMEQISKIFDFETWFSFQTGREERDRTILQKFLMEQERHAGLGKEYTGCVLIELSGEEEEKEFFDFLNYISIQKYRLYCIFTTKVLEQEEIFKKQLEQHFFVRVVCGTNYEVKEQLELFESTLESYQFLLEEEAKEELEEFFGKKKWKETDMVKKRIQNMAKDLVYQKMLTSKEMDCCIKMEDIDIAAEKFEKTSEKKRQIGFVLGGMEA